MKKFFFIALASCFVFLLFVSDGFAAKEPKPKAQKLIRRGKIEKTKKLFTTPAQINLVDKEGNTALHVAAEKNEEDLIAFFVVKGAELEIKNFKGETPLHVAVRHKSYEAARSLTLLGADIFARNSEGKTALECAIDDGIHEEEKEDQLQEGAKKSEENSIDNSAQTAKENSAENSSQKNKKQKKSRNVNAAQPSSAQKVVQEKTSQEEDDEDEKEIKREWDGEVERFFEVMVNEKTAELRDEAGNSVVHYFALTENRRALNFCIGKKINIDSKNNAGLTPLAILLQNPQTFSAAQMAADLIIAGAESVECEAFYFERAVSQRSLSVRLSDGQTPLHLATIYGHNGIAEYLLENKVDVKAQDISGATALHEAVRYGRTKIARLLIANKAEVNGTDSLGKTPLLLVVPTEQRKKIYRLLLKNGANVKQKDMFGDTILHVASMTDVPVEQLQWFLEAGAELDIRNKNGATPLATALEYNNALHINFYAVCGADIHAEDHSKKTPLISALSRSDEIYKSLIIEQNATSIDSEGNTPLILALKNDSSFEKISYIENFSQKKVNARNRKGESALYVAAEKNNKAAGELLLSHGADIFATNTQNVSPLKMALESGNGSEQWIINSENVSARDGSGNTALHYATEWKVPANTVSLLIQKGCSVNAVNSNGETPLFSAAKADNEKIIRLLSQNNANILARDNLGSTPLHSAVRWNSLSSAEALIDSGISLNPQNVGGKTPLSEAAVDGKIAFAKLLLSRGADPNLYDTDGRTALNLAVRAKQTEMVNVLLSARANPQIQDLNGRTAYHEAAILGNIEMIKALRTVGANPLTRDKNGNTPLSFSFKHDSKVMYAVLGNIKMIVDTEGNTPMHVAVSSHVAQPILKSLIINDYPLDIRNSAGDTPLSLAAKTEQFALCDMLLEHGANPFAETNSKGDNTVTLALETGNRDFLQSIVQKTKTKTDLRGNTLLHYAARLGDSETINLLLGYGLSKYAKNVSGELPQDVAKNWKKTSNASLLAVE